jgi:hypothetical protein
MKNAISWKELVSKTAKEQKKEGIAVDFKKVLHDAGVEWKKIKSGKHDLFMVDDATKKAHTSSATKTKKAYRKTKKSIKNKKSEEHCDAKMILSKNILCKSCKGKVEKLMKTNKKQSGGQLSPDDYQKQDYQKQDYQKQDYQKQDYQNQSVNQEENNDNKTYENKNVIPFDN